MGTRVPTIRKYLDVGHTPRDEGGEGFTVFWRDFTGTLKRLSLFLLTISYMPVARAILQNFAGMTVSNDGVVGIC